MYSLFPSFLLPRVELIKSPVNGSKYASSALPCFSPAFQVLWLLVYLLCTSSTPQPSTNVTARTTALK